MENKYNWTIDLLENHLRCFANGNILKKEQREIKKVIRILRGWQMKAKYLRFENLTIRQLNKLIKNVKPEKVKSFKRRIKCKKTS
jgi:hypothetical protein